MKQIRRFLATSAPASVILIRLVVGFTFLFEGIQKFLYPTALGVGRFAKIGLPSPEFLAPFVGVVEIVCGTLIIVGLLTRWASVALLIGMIVGITANEMAVLLT